jgi:hypothetical protein
MALTFPANPINGQIYDQYVYDATAQSWRVYGSDTGITNVLATKSNLSGGNTFTGNQTFNNYILNPSSAAFYVVNGSGTITLNTTISFPVVYVNANSVYNTSNGRFTAPVTGTYKFTVGMIGNNLQDVWRMWYYKNDAKIADLHARSDGNATGSEYMQVEKTVILNLAANDFITIRITSDAGNAVYPSGDYVHFGGFLIG